ncbi:MAG: hypothetical protein CMO55_23325 [Verrucomicrobiales bacterium]|nr:hypothetical protein [Verrucomicrobiales bacterium]
MLRSFNPEIRGGRGFAKEMRKLLTELEGGDISREWKYHRPRFIPDAFVIKEDEEEVWVIEIEDTHPLTTEKLRRLIDFYWWLDGYCWDLRVFTANRYGQNKSEIPLFAYHYALHSSGEPDPRISQLTDHQAMSLIDLAEGEVDAYLDRCIQENKAANTVT